MKTPRLWQTRLGSVQSREEGNLEDTEAWGEWDFHLPVRRSLEFILSTARFHDFSGCWGRGQGEMRGREQ